MSAGPEPRGVALDVDGLDAFYGKSQVGFGLSLRIDAGETVAVLGRNGAGKTSMLMAIAGSISPAATSPACPRSSGCARASRSSRPARGPSRI
jgi:ABC-type multidrug transport system ATPase subunit